LGTDTAGSVRIPASFCGCVGFKPSFNRYSGEGVVPLALSRDTVGLLARSVDEIMRVDAVLCEKAAEEKQFDDNTEQLRIGIPRSMLPFAPMFLFILPFFFHFFCSFVICYLFICFVFSVI
jgi:mandelamide amidase